MRIGIDARLFGPLQGGLGRYVEQLILHFETLDVEAEFVVFLRKSNWNDYQPSKPNFRKVLADIPWYSWQEQLLLPGIFKKEKLDLLHVPHWNVPLFYNGPFVVTIHDLLLLHFPTRTASTLGPLSYWFKNTIFKKVLRHAVRAAKHIITVSEFSKNDIEHTLSVTPEKITVTYLAPSPARRNTAGKELRAWSITKPYLLYVGVAFPHKNLATLLRAWKIFEQKYGASYQLVLAGKKNYFYQQLERQIQQADIADVILTDFVSDNDLETLYRHATLYVFPSLYEGFGIPPLEALMRGVPVVTSRSTCLPEILRDAAHFVDATDPTAIADGCYQLITDAPLRQKLRAAVPQVLARYSWQATAQATLAIYQKTVDNNR